jgi:hypothetical protein
VLGQRELPAILQIGVGYLGLGRGQVCLGLIDLRLELHLLDLVQQVARLDVLALAEQHLFEEALDPRAHLHLVDGLDPSDKFEGSADAPHRRRPHAHRRVRRRCGGLLRLVAARQ